MSEAGAAPRVAIVDHGLGNLYSVKHACAQVGLNATITAAKADLLAAEAVILPGVGAFGDAMETLTKLDLVSVLRDIAAASRPLVGVCLGLQLLMTESYEFGRHRGLGIVDGPVVRFQQPRENGRLLKVPQIGWNRIRRAPAEADPWAGTLLEGVPEAAHMYFVHSYHVQPQDPRVVLSYSRYGDVEFCSSLQIGNVFACQFHPERSGPVGLSIYRRLTRQLAPQGEAA